MKSAAVIWNLKKGADRRFRSGHPWVFSNELQTSPKGLDPGAPVELRDAGGKFMAWGYGNPQSLIAFRAVSRNPEEADALDASGLARKIESARQLRTRLGFGEASCRMVYGEADGLPGLIVDRYRALDAGRKAHTVFVVQAHTAGAQRWLGYLPEILNEGALIVRNDLGIRKMEGLTEEEPRVERAVSGLSLSPATLLVANASGGRPLELQADLVKGQKTGFFLDQWANVELTIRRVLSGFPEKGPVRILDLCSYVGQWGVQIGHALARHSRQVEVVAVDSSESALALAKTNLESNGITTVRTVKADVLHGLDEFLGEEEFDLVISDPPAFIKGRKAIPEGKHAYLQLNTQAVRRVRPGGWIVSCSCSSLLEEADFLAALSKAARRNQRNIRWVARGGGAPDHPVRAEFPEGAYLKAWIGNVEAGE